MLMDTIGEMIKTFLYRPGSHLKTLSILREEVPSLILRQLIFKYTSNILAVIIYLQLEPAPNSLLLKDPIS
jgi:hypothetical protein